MSTMFDTKRQAIDFGLCIFEVDDRAMRKKDMNMDIGMDVYELNTKDGMKEIGIEPFRSGYCLWVIRPNGFMVRL